MTAGLTALGAHRWEVLAAIGGLVALTIGLGLGLRHLTGRMATMRAQLLVITIAGVVVGAVAAWVLAALMILEEDQVGAILLVLLVTAVVGSAIVFVASAVSAPPLTSWPRRFARSRMATARSGQECVAVTSSVVWAARWTA
ncbi:MAG: hypothetical protein R2698_12235 [Microthrixaceae bacterium]